MWGDIIVYNIRHCVAFVRAIIIISLLAHTVLVDTDIFLFLEDIPNIHTHTTLEADEKKNNRNLVCCFTCFHINMEWYGKCIPKRGVEEGCVERGTVERGTHSKSKNI